MASNTCSDCDQGFSRKDAMLRHKRNKHYKDHPITDGYEVSEEGPPQQTLSTPPPPPTPLQREQPVSNNEFKFRHPFTMIVSGPTSSGKSFLVKRILQHNLTIVHPPAQRIIWLYRRWQPLYDVIRATVTPRVEFIQGIPLHIETDTFFDPAIRNMVVLDDLMSVKDNRINDLFTEGSHHRNLSVISINQNLYYNKDPTQRRNCQYLILFKSPMDKQSVLSLSRQMYPTRSSHFMEQFENATGKPYSYLLLDLKADTLECNRFKTNIFGTDPHQSTNHLSTDFPVDRRNSDNGTQTDSEMELETNEIASCEDCGIMFENIHDLYRHVRKWCPENHSESFKKQRQSEMLETPAKLTKLEYDGHISTEEERRVFENLMRLSKKSNEERWLVKYDKYIKQGATEQEAEVKAELKVQPLDIADVLQKYTSLLVYIIQLRHGLVHEQVMDAISDFISDGYSEKSAVRMTVKKYKHLIEEYLDTTDSDNLVDDDEESTQSDGNGDELTSDETEDEVDD
ncbi:MAG: C2H2-type zinc finger protein [Sedimenticola sp.]